MTSVRSDLSPRDVDGDLPLPDGLEDGDRLGVGEALGRVTVHREDFVTWKKEKRKNKE